MQDKKEIVENILARFYENRVFKVSKDGKKVEVKLVILDDRLAKNASFIVSKYNTLSLSAVKNEQIYTMYSVLMKEDKFTPEQLLELTDLDIIKLTIKHLRFHTFQLLNTEDKRETTWVKKADRTEGSAKTIKTNIKLVSKSLDLMLEKSSDSDLATLTTTDYTEKENYQISEFKEWFNVNKYKVLYDKQIFFLNNLEEAKAGSTKLHKSILNNKSVYFKNIELNIANAYEKYKKTLLEQPDGQNVNTHFKEYIELFENEKYIDCLDLLVKVVKSSDHVVNEKVIIKNQYSEIEDYLSDELELRYMRQILNYSKTKSANDVKQSTLVEVYRLLQKGLKTGGITC